MVSLDMMLSGLHRFSFRKEQVWHFENAHCAGNAFLVAWQKQHCDTVITFRRKQAPALLRFFSEETVRYLEKDACTVTGVLLQADAATMLKVYKHRQRVIEHLMGSLALHVSQRTNAARVMLELWPI